MYHILLTFLIITIFTLILLSVIFTYRRHSVHFRFFCSLFPLFSLSFLFFMFSCVCHVNFSRSCYFPLRVPILYFPIFVFLICYVCFPLFVIFLSLHLFSPLTPHDNPSSLSASHMSSHLPPLVISIVTRTGASEQVCVGSNPLRVRLTGGTDRSLVTRRLESLLTWPLEERVAYLTARHFGRHVC